MTPEPTVATIFYSLVIVSIMWIFIYWAVKKRDRDMITKNYPSARKEKKLPKVIDIKLDEFEKKLG